LCVLSFIIVGITTIWFFIIKSDESNTEKVRDAIAKAKFEIKNIISVKDSLPNNRYKNQILLQRLNELSENNNLDFVIYNPDGSLLLSSSNISEVFDKGIQNSKMNPVAYHHLNTNKEISFMQDEYIGSLKYISHYIAISEKTPAAEGINISNSKFESRNKLYAYLNIPYLESKNTLKKEISNFLVIIINLNAFIFLLAGIISLFITQRISSSFLFISEKMKKINLTRQNEYIEWKRDDEIGLLVSEYNKMVFKLEESAEALAKTEREGAWKEMAKQVAHEIKNPLTPMKLNIQFLQKAISNNEPNVKELASKMSVMLIEQIDHLSNIANQFSQFANLSESKLEVFDLNELINQVLQLNAQTNNVQILQNLSDKIIRIKADKTNMNRLFTNLVLNAIQSVPESREAVIQVNKSIEDDDVIIEIADNGAGIDDAAIQKIFTPNFTTKNSGTGLGLAMCKKIVEQTGGEIWFETEKDKGTSFFVKLPLA
jgi:signal transduction histidine kinase